MDEGINVLSCFDGMSCGQIALKRAGIKVNKYFASEIDNHAIKVTQTNFPNTIQLGDVKSVYAKDLPRIDMLLGGSPCQGFSVSGKHLNFNDPRSALFFEFVRIYKELKEINPEIKFLLENVEMKKSWLGIISKHMGIFPVKINSALVSAQNRERYYWTNIRTRDEGFFNELWTDIPQPDDRGIFLKDICQPEEEIDQKFYIKNPKVDLDKIKTKKGSSKNLHELEFDSETFPVVNDRGSLRETEKSQCIDANYYKGMDNHAQRSMICVAMRGRKDNKDSPIIQKIEERKDNKTNTLTTVEKDNLVKVVNYIPGEKQIPQQDRIYDVKGKMTAITEQLGGRFNIQQGSLYESNAQAGRIYSDEGKSVTLKSEGGGLGAKTGLYNIQTRIRRLTPIECERLQTVDDNYTNHVSDTRRYHMLGNGWTIEVIKHILSFYK